MDALVVCIYIAITVRCFASCFPKHQLARASTLKVLYEIQMADLINFVWFTYSKFIYYFLWSQFKQTSF
jgi:hypothetical protein